MSAEVRRQLLGSLLFLSGGFQGSNQAIGFADEHQHLLRHLASFTQVCSGDPGAQGRSRVHGGGRGGLSSTGAEGRLSFVDLTSCLSSAPHQIHRAFCPALVAEPGLWVGETDRAGVTEVWRTEANVRWYSSGCQLPCLQRQGHSLNLELEWDSGLLDCSELSPHPSLVNF